MGTGLTAAASPRRNLTDGASGCGDRLRGQVLPQCQGTEMTLPPTPRAPVQQDKHCRQILTEGHSTRSRQRLVQPSRLQEDGGVGETAPVKGSLAGVTTKCHIPLGSWNRKKIGINKGEQHVLCLYEMLKMGNVGCLLPQEVLQFSCKPKAL